MADLEIARSDNFTLFNPAFIDDYGFTPEEFRVFARIVRRSIGESSAGCYESIPHMAQFLKMSERLVRRSLNVLATCRAISRTVREGQTDLLVFNPCDKWKPASDLVSIRKIYTPVENATSSGNARGSGNATTTGYKNARGVVAETQGKGISPKVYPFKEKKKKSRKEKVTPLETGFRLTDDLISWAATETPNVSVEYFTKTFRDHYEGQVAARWTVRWKKWMRNEYTGFGKILPCKPQYRNGSGPKKWNHDL